MEVVGSSPTWSKTAFARFVEIPTERAFFVANGNMTLWVYDYQRTEQESIQSDESQDVGAPVVTRETSESAEDNQVVRNRK